MTLHQFLRIVEIRTKIVSVSTLTLAFLWTWAAHGSFNPLVAVLMITATLMVDMGTTAFNSFYDYMHGVDAKETNREEDKVLVHQNVGPGWALLVSLGLYTGAGLLGLVIAWLTSPWILAVGTVSLAVGFLYNGGPRPLSSTPLGELFAGGFLGGVLFLLVVFTQTGSLVWQDWWAALPSTVFIACILTVNNTCDAVGDKTAGRLTLSILIGPQASRLLIPLEIMMAYISMILFIALVSSAGPLGWETILMQTPLALAAGLSMPSFLALDRRGYSHQTKGPSMGGISQLFLIFTLGMAGSLLVNILLETGIRGVS